MITGLAHVCISSDRLDAAEDFYCGALGCRKIFDFIRGGETIGFYLELPGGAYIEVFLQERIDASAAAPIRHICIETPDLSALVAGLRQRGIEVSDKTLGADRSWQAWVTDPSGVRIEFHEYTDQSSQRTHRDCVLD